MEIEYLFIDQRIIAYIIMGITTMFCVKEIMKNDDKKKKK